jgi:membrane-bound lytic murein transglycosylase A
MRPSDEMPALQDDLEFANLVSALEANLKIVKEAPEKAKPFYFGPRVISKREYARALETLLEAAKSDPTGENFRKTLKENFEPFEVYGMDRWGEVFITSYYEPVIPGSRKHTERFSHPIYAAPKDMVLVDLQSFSKAKPSLLQGRPLEQRSSENILRGRLTTDKDGSQRVVAYPSRSEIYSGAIKNQKILAWADPIDVFFLEIQGSGLVHFEDGKDIKVGYASQNGYPYFPIGKSLLDVIPREKMSMQAIEAYLRSLPPAKAQKIMENNQSYVFFRELETAGVTFVGAEVVPGRTIATDQMYFPKGALAYLEFEKPVFTSPSATEPKEWQKTSRFVFDQDTGGAIRGPARVDLFWGRGPVARQSAGVIKNKGRLVYFVPKAEFLARLATN